MNQKIQSLNILRGFKEVEEIQKAYEKGQTVYSDTPQNRKMNRVGKPYTEAKKTEKQKITKIAKGSSFEIKNEGGTFTQKHGYRRPGVITFKKGDKVKITDTLIIRGMGEAVEFTINNGKEKEILEKSKFIKAIKEDKKDFDSTYNKEQAQAYALGLNPDSKEGMQKYKLLSLKADKFESDLKDLKKSHFTEKEFNEWWTRTVPHDEGKEDVKFILQDRKLVI